MASVFSIFFAYIQILVILSLTNPPNNFVRGICVKNLFSAFGGKCPSPAVGVVRSRVNRAVKSDFKVLFCGNRGFRGGVIRNAAGISYCLTVLIGVNKLVFKNRKRVGLVVQFKRNGGVFKLFFEQSQIAVAVRIERRFNCLLYTSPSPRD